MLSEAQGNLSFEHFLKCDNALWTECGHNAR